MSTNNEDKNKKEKSLKVPVETKKKIEELSKITQRKQVVVVNIAVDEYYKGVLEGKYK